MEECPKRCDTCQNVSQAPEIFHFFFPNSEVVQLKDAVLLRPMILKRNAPLHMKNTAAHFSTEIVQTVRARHMECELLAPGLHLCTHAVQTLLTFQIVYRLIMA